MVELPSIPLGLPSAAHTRLAPTPSGYLHTGNLLNFALSWALARATGGRVLLRIDDLDRERFRESYLNDIFFVLTDLGLDWDEGPEGPSEFYHRYSQSLRSEEYQQLLGKIWERSKVFACACTRLQSNLNGAYSGHCADLEISFEPGLHQLRLDTRGWGEWALQQELNPLFQRAGALKLLSYPVLLQKNQTVSYQVASLSEDLRFGTRLIVRGEDLLESSLLQEALKTRVLQVDSLPWTFWHHPLLRDKDGKKLSKSSGAQSTSLRSQPQWKEEFWTCLAEFMHWTHEAPRNAVELVEVVRARISENNALS